MFLETFESKRKFLDSKQIHLFKGNYCVFIYLSPRYYSYSERVLS